MSREWKTGFLRYRNTLQTQCHWRYKGTLVPHVISINLQGGERGVADASLRVENYTAVRPGGQSEGQRGPMTETCHDNEALE